MAIDLEKLNIKIMGDSTDASASVQVLIDYLKELRQTAEELKQSTNNVGKMFDGIKNGAKNAAQAASQASSSLDGMSNHSSRITSSKSGIDSLADSYKGLKDEVKETALAFGSGDSKIAKFMASVKRIAMYRMIRSGIKAVTQAVREGLDILVEWDRTYGNNTSFAAQTTDELAAKWYELKKSIGAAIMPIIQILEPALMWVMDAVINIANILNQIVRSVQGYSDYMKATYRTTKSTVGAAKELRRVLFGFDELNVLPSQSGSGASENVSAWDYDPTEIDDTWLSLGERLKGIWDDLNKNFEGTMDAIKRVFEGTGKVLKGLLNGDWQMVGEGIVDIFKGAAEATWLSIKGFVNTTWEWLFGETPKITQFAEDLSQAFKDGLITKEELWTIFSNLFGFTEKNLWSGWDDFWKDLKKSFYVVLYELASYIDEHPVISKLFKAIFGIDSSALKAAIEVKFTTDTFLSADTKKLYEIVNGAVHGATIWIGANQMSMGVSGVLSGAFASGGDPIKGTLFYAGEAGAEVVANTPGGTGVMNMQQMQDAVSNGNTQVVNAVGIMANMVVQAIQEKSLDLYIGDDAIGKSATRYQNGRLRATGVPVTARG